MNIQDKAIAGFVAEMPRYSTPFVEQDCTISFSGKSFESGGAVITDEYLIAYPAANGQLHDWHGNTIGTWRVIAGQSVDPLPPLCRAGSVAGCGTGAQASSSRQVKGNDTMKTDTMEQKQAQHTPGPWTVDHVWALIKGPQDQEICAVHAAEESKGRLPRDRAAANARLIAQAPALLAALRAVLPYAEQEASALEQHSDDEAAERESKRAWAEIAAARAAIAAATNGEGSV